MTFAQYWALVAKRWKLIVVCFVVVGLGAYIGSKLTTPRYQSLALVQVAIQSSNNQANYDSLLASDQLVQTEAQLATSDPVLREVASHYADMTAQELADEVTSTAKTNTQLFEIDVLDANPHRAADLANDIAKTLIKQQSQQSQQENILSQQQLQQDLDSTQQQINQTTSQIADLQNKPGSQGRLAALRAQLSGLQQHYNQWQTALAQLELTNAQSGNFLILVQSAQPALRPSQPNVSLNTAGGFAAGLFLGLLLAVLFEQLDTRIHSAEELSELLDWTALGTIWRSRTADKQEMINPQGRAANAESYRILRTNIGFSGIDSPVRTMMVTSPLPGDGKSTIAANVAIFMAKAGKNTLLVDADLRRPTQHQIFDLGAEKKGFSNAVLMFSKLPTSSSGAAQFITPTSSLRSNSLPGVSQIGLEQFIHSVGIPNLRVMPSGPLPPNPSELLDSEAMKRLQEALAASGAEVIIYDSPPIRGLSDSSILASKVDGTLVVVDITRSNKHHLKQVKALLTQAGAHVLGCVINKQRRNRHDSSYSYYYYYRREDAAPESNNGHKPVTHVADEPTNVMQATGSAVHRDNRKGGQSRDGK